jgi:hypothetical protein
MSTTRRELIQEPMAARATRDMIIWWSTPVDERRAQPRASLSLALGNDRTAAGTGG